LPALTCKRRGRRSVETLTPTSRDSTRLRRERTASAIPLEPGRAHDETAIGTPEILVDISPTLAAQLSALKQSIGEPGDLEDAVLALAHHVRAAVASYLGMTISVAAHGYGVNFTIHEDALSTRAVAASIRIPLDDESGGDTSSLVLYAATPGAFVDLAADLSYAMGNSSDPFALDSDLTAPSAGSGISGLEAHSRINQAIGILIDEGFTADSARDELRGLADRDNSELLDAAERLLRGAGPSGVEQQKP
jgi:hypothetical protein